MLMIQGCEETERGAGGKDDTVLEDLKVLFI